MRFPLLTFVATAALLFGACSGDGGPGKGAAPSAPPAAGAAERQLTLTYFNLDG